MASSEDRHKDKRREKETVKAKDRERKDKAKGKPKATEKGRRGDDDSEEDIEKEKEKDKMAFLAAIKGLRDKDKAKDRRKSKKCSSSRSASQRKEKKKETKRKREPSRSRDSSGSSPPPPKLIAANGFGQPLSFPVSSVVPAAAGASDVIGVFCRSAGADQNSEQALRALPVHLQQLVMAEGSIAGLNPSAMLLQRIRKVESNASAANAAAFAGARPGPRPDTVAAAAAGDPVAKFCMLHQVDYSAENALRALPVELQCKILNEGPLRASNPSAVLMSRIRKAQTLLAEMRRLGKVSV